MRTDGVIVDTLVLERIRGSSPDGLQVLGQRLPIPQAPDERPVHVIDARGVLSVDRTIPPTPNGVVELSHVSLSGDTLSHLSLNYTPKAWSQEGISVLMAAPLRIWSNRVGAGADTSVAAAAMREAIDLPSYQVPVSTVRLASDGVIWLERERDPSLQREVVLIDPADGARGVVTLPESVDVLWSNGATVWASLTDELDVPWLVRYRISQ
jgi:hypothetical protein